MSFKDPNLSAAILHMKYTLGWQDWWHVQKLNQIIRSSGITALRLYFSLYREPVMYCMWKAFWNLSHLWGSVATGKRKCGDVRGRTSFSEHWIQDSLLKHAESLKGFICKKFSITHFVLMVKTKRFSLLTLSQFWLSQNKYDRYIIDISCYSLTYWMPWWNSLSVILSLGYLMYSRTLKNAFGNINIHLSLLYLIWV